VGVTTVVLGIALGIGGFAGCSSSSRGIDIDTLVESLNLNAQVDLNVECPVIPPGRDQLLVAAVFSNQPRITPDSPDFPANYCPANTRFYARAEGHGKSNRTDLVEFAWREQYCALPGFEIVADGYFEAPNGDRLTWDALVRADSIPPPQPHATFSGKFTFTGGTGVFADKTGKANIAAQQLGDAPAPGVLGSTAVALCGWIDSVDGEARPSVYADSLIHPLGLEFDRQGRLWVAEQGTGENDGRLSVVTPDGRVHHVLSDLRSAVFFTSPLSAEQLHFHKDRLLLMYWGSLLAVDAEGLSGGGPVRSVDTTLVANFVPFLKAEGYPEFNPYDFTFGPGDDLYVVDAAANAILRRRSVDGSTEVFAAFDKLPSTSGTGSPSVEAVPTGIVFTGEQFLVSILSGLPYREGLAGVYAVDMEGNVSQYWEGLTLLTDILLYPSTGTLLALQLGRLKASASSQSSGSGVQSSSVPNSGRLIALGEGTFSTIIDRLNQPVAMTIGPNGDIFISSFADGEILRIDAELIAAAGSSRGQR